MSGLATVRAVQAALPDGGLFHEKEWRIAPRPFEISPEFREELDKLGYRLVLFLKACDQLYRLSAKGRQPQWVADLLDAGKPPELVAFQRDHGLAGDIPRVIRPDLVLTAEGYTIAEIDSVPGGIGLTAWLNKTYSDLGHNVLGGADGMLDGFARILPGGDILISEEAATYRPEMNWLAGQLNASFASSGHWRVLDATPRTDWQPQLYRFFELFDLAQVPATEALQQNIREKSHHITPPSSPHSKRSFGSRFFGSSPWRIFGVASWESARFWPSKNPSPTRGSSTPPRYPVMPFCPASKRTHGPKLATSVRRNATLFSKSVAFPKKPGVQEA